MKGGEERPKGRWFVRERRLSDPDQRLFCFSYAGGSSQVFAGWQAHFGPYTEVLAVELPGRGRRFPEPPVGDIHLLVAALADAVVPLLDRPFYLFGHSNGALLAYELARSLAQSCLLLPRMLFLAGKRAPQLSAEAPQLHHLPDAAFVEALKRYNGTPETVLKNEELLSVFLPILRADFRLGEVYRHRWEVPLAVEACLLGGKRDRTVPERDLLAWREVIAGPVEHLRFDGDHFFIHEQRSAVIDAIRARIGERFAGAGQTSNAGK